MVFPFFFVWGAPMGGLAWAAISLGGTVVLWLILNSFFFKNHHLSPDAAEETLRQRLARGEIDEETYRRLRDTLRR